MRHTPEHFVYNSSAKNKFSAQLANIFDYQPQTNTGSKESITSLNEDMDQKSFRKFLEMQSLATISPKPHTAATSNFEYGGNLGRSRVDSHVKPFTTKY